MGGFQVTVGSDLRQPVIQISLQFHDGLVNLAPERDLIKLLQDGLVEACADVLGLRMEHLSIVWTSPALPDYFQIPFWSCSNAMGLI